MERGSCHFRWSQPTIHPTGKAKQWVKSGFDKQTGNFLFTPLVPDSKTVAENLETETTMVTLVPYGSSKLRITYFPRCETTP